MLTQVRLIRTGMKTRVELDGEDISSSVTHIKVELSPREVAHVVLDGVDGAVVLDGPAEVTMQAEQPAKPSRPTAPNLLTREPGGDRASIDTRRVTGRPDRGGDDASP